MAVNPSSVIPTWLNNYWPELYVSLTDKEDYAYINFGTGSGTQTQFSALAARINGYKNILRTPKVRDIIQSIYSYKAMQQNFNLGDIDLTNYSYDKVFSFGSFGTNTLTRPTSYYNDWAGSPLVSARLTSGIDYIQNDAIDDEDNLISQAVEDLTQDFQNQIDQYLFVDPPAPETPASKQSLGIYIFNTLLYKKVYSNLNVTPLTLPPYITP